jgi:F0F1-type ATP synthase assembly protein I
MPWGLGDSGQLGYYLSLAQVGVEFAGPLVVGVLLDLYLGWSPWGVVIGGLLGFVGGMYHLVSLAGKQPPGKSKRSPEDRPL